MNTLKGFQKKYLRALAHNLKPVVQIGHKGVTDTVVRAVDEALDRHELIKIKFVDYKEKDYKQTFADDIARQSGAEIVGMIGHTVIFFRQHTNPEKRKIKLPSRKM